MRHHKAPLPAIAVHSEIFLLLRGDRSPWRAAVRDIAGKMGPKMIPRLFSSSSSGFEQLALL